MRVFFYVTIMLGDVMKYKSFIFIFLAMVITLIFYFVFIKLNILNFQNTEEFLYLESHVSDIEKFVVKTDTLLGEHCYLIDSNKGYNVLKNIEIKKETNMTITDSDMYFQIYFNSGKNVIFKFEGENLEYNGEKYILKNPIVSYKEDYVSDEINEYMIIVSENDEVECVD